MGMMVKIAEIAVGERHRKDMGDLKALAENIREQGLLQPIGITEDKVLVFGERRMRACEAYLKWNEIDCRIVNVTSILEGEYAENEMRRAFTPSERIAIAEAVERKLGERRGRPRPAISKLQGKENVPNRAQFPTGTKSRDIAAKAAGFSSHQQMERTAKVVQFGAPKVVEKMDAGEISISKAAELVNLPAREQVAAVTGPTEADAAEKREEATRQLIADTEHSVAVYGSSAYTDYVLKHGRRPDRETAATIGALLGGQVRADDGSMQPPKSASQKAAERDERDGRKERSLIAGECSRATYAIANLGANKLSPAEVARNIDRWQAPTILANLENAVDWLNRFAKEWRVHVK
ncbi:ParB N-terminal domain-containing protein [Kaistia dalseonensis]|uniref:ParB-like N-terminal domain-containing protein n=1 Tax=Kaistia dalseonensis TaxID=410840 RepID=A0ABU0H7J5_9HYPH|nr:ParB N-terminal domain-containing protein [Kaistia dalseonensis]MCX5495407.1 ParB N-terminal domain-containing protein [Kaistia dalseonensis]MDQ0437997.1 hypothetical protein [Kaistia dalseonensis]